MVVEDREAFWVIGNFFGRILTTCILVREPFHFQEKFLMKRSKVLKAEAEEDLGYDKGKAEGL